METIAELLERTPAASAADAALVRLRRCLDDDGPIVTWLWGDSGHDISALLDGFAANSHGTTFVRIDCRSVEPTHAGLLDELGAASGAGLADSAARLCASAHRVILAFEHYEVFRLADGWLRRDFIPALGRNARVVLASVEEPSAGWTSALEWQPWFASIRISGEPTTAGELLSSSDTAGLRDLLEAVAVVRRITKPLLATLLDDSDVNGAWRTLAQLPFVESRRDGLALSDVVRRELATSLQAAEPGRYRELQRRAWRVLRSRLRDTSRADLWRATADAIFLIENPVVREAFFPSESARFAVEPATPGDRDVIIDIAARNDPSAGVAALELWWKHLPTAFSTIRDGTGQTVGFYCVARPDEVGQSWMRFDPVASRWQAHLGSSRHEALFLRRWLATDAGEAPGPVQAAAWVDVKRLYLELRPGLRRVYLALQDLGPYAAVATELGFAVLEDHGAVLDERPFYTAMLDFGPASVDGWIGNLVAAELGVSEDSILDNAARALVLDGERITLTPLEYGVVALLESRAGTAVSRDELLQKVWGKDHEGGSNVVDAVIRGLRRKCGERAQLFGTVRGVGYRLVTDS